MKIQPLGIVEEQAHCRCGPGAQFIPVLLDVGGQRLGIDRCLLDLVRALSELHAGVCCAVQAAQHLVLEGELGWRGPGHRRGAEAAVGRLPASLLQDVRQFVREQCAATFAARRPGSGCEEQVHAAGEGLRAESGRSALRRCITMNAHGRQIGSEGCLKHRTQRRGKGSAALPGTARLEAGATDNPAARPRSPRRNAAAR
ncbi:hypothetical protein LP415_02025 [Polaromonas sp. P1(28)-8]|nr:hypothetical protein LP415_02025 [Polaromonas sp. P1(28)-8]